jgi:putative glutamine amidotransferase
VKALIAVPAYPLIGSGRIERFNDDAVAVPASYVRALRRAGGIEAILLPTPLDGGEAAALMARYDGLLLLGGGDLEPATYGQDADHTVYEVDVDRDANELALVTAAVATGNPVLAICRGHQVLNVALGGTLDQHITDREGLAEHGKPGVEDGSANREIDIVAGTRLADAVGTTHVTGSCHHHQAVERVGDGLRVVARADDGVIEGIELTDPDGPWVVGVQWHPEDTAADDPAQQRLFDRFVDVSSDRSRGARS